MKKTTLIILLISGCISLNAQPYKNLVFEGAGIKGLAYAGSIRVLEEKKMLDSVEKVAGTSAGAIAALALAVGYTASEIESIIYSTKLQKFNDGKFFFVGGIARMKKNYGWYRGKAVTRWLEKIIANRTGDANITFRQLHEKKFRDLYVTGTSLNNQRLIVFSRHTYPDMRIKDAVRISMSIPLYFEAVYIDAAGRIVKGENTTAPFDIMVDGGFTGNFPISVFDSSDSVGKTIQNRHTLGLRIDSPMQVKYDSASMGLAPIPVSGFRNYLGAFYKFVLENLNRSSLSPYDWQRTVSISSGNIGSRIRKLSPEEKNLLITNGRVAMEKFLEKNSLVEK